MRSERIAWQGWVSLVVLTVAVASGVGGCAEAGAPAGEEGAVGRVEYDDPNAAPTYTTTISLEGTPQSIEVRDFITPIGFPLGFRTVFPADMKVDFVTSGTGDEVRFEAAFGGNHRPDAALVFRALPARLNAEDAADRVATMAAELGAERVETWDGDWAHLRYRLTGERSGFLALGSRGDAAFYLMASYPPEFGDGMGPRVDMILHEWRWADDGSPLLPE